MTSISPDGHKTQLASEVNTVIPTQRNLETSMLVTNSVIPHQSLNISIDTSSLAGDTGGFPQHRPPPPQLNDDMYSFSAEDLMADGDINIDACDNEMSDNTTSNLQCLMHLLKGNIGTGILAMPVAIYNAGLWTGFAGILLIGAMAVHCMHMLIRCSHILCRRTGCKSLSYSDAIETCLKTGPQRLKKFARASRHVVNGLLLFTQLGFCSVYIVFIAENLQQIVQTMTSHDPNLRVYEVVVMVLLIPYTLLRNLRVLAPFSSFANLLTMTGVYNPHNANREYLLDLLVIASLLLSNSCHSVR